MRKGAAMEHVGRHAVVVGNGMAGLFSAAVVSQFFDHVTVLDRDAEPTWAAPRKAVPQGYHFHALLLGGLEAMEHWFPGFTDEMVEAGSVPMQIGRDFSAWWNEGRSYSLQAFLPEPFDGEVMYTQTRPLLESCVRRRVSALRNVTFRHRATVTSPLVADGRVIGVALADGSTCSADLVIDAGGRNGMTARWIEAMGYGAVPESHVECGVHYATAMVTPSDWDALDGVATFILDSGEGEHGSRSGIVVRTDHGRWIVGLAGRYGDAPPTDWQGFVEFGATLPWPIWSEMVATVAPTDEIHSYALPRSIRRHFEHIDSFPNGLLPIGDSICFFNPAHGQGMSSAAVQCRLLETALIERAQTGRTVDGLASELFPALAEWIRGPWALAAAIDFGHPECSGDFPVGDLGDLELLGRAAADPSTAGVALDIVMLRKPLSAVRCVA